VADGNRRITARIREIAAAADPASRTYRVKATLLRGRKKQRLGKTARCGYPVTTSSHPVPLSAVFTPQNEPGRPVVRWWTKQAGTVRSVPVQMGEALDGERIVVAGSCPDNWSLAPGSSAWLRDRRCACRKDRGGHAGYVAESKE